MRSHTDFWLVLHQLAGELKHEAEGGEGRLEQLAALLRTSPPSTRAICCANLQFVVEVLTALQHRCGGHCQDGAPSRDAAATREREAR